ncbi:hypothetical protein A3D09_01095 [Candidatus Collierbacteria bacterium RIFCSPHIGHO2_02_FULL_49_10]|uniref:Uncharacterized protein n=1 Tax=Candidatus Collierbacteria bacterium RIFCSPHIGHO2_02_FULL_49_10 TaxID=1817723 RepID=A0A1F5EVD4_9BACT|nr:MAG: hypothetical protein A3D09_01095 [Candidatus Collierbacteria bacterium RIFCSPHIGHO2_02_FULL_49_10]
MGLQLEYFWAAINCLGKDKLESNLMAKKVLNQAFADLSARMKLFGQGGDLRTWEMRKRFG